MDRDDAQLLAAGARTVCINVTLTNPQQGAYDHHSGEKHHRPRDSARRKGVKPARWHELAYDARRWRVACEALAADEICKSSDLSFPQAQTDSNDGIERCRTSWPNQAPGGRHFSRREDNYNVLPCGPLPGVLRCHRGLRGNRGRYHDALQIGIFVFGSVRLVMAALHVSRLAWRTFVWSVVFRNGFVRCLSSLSASFVM